MKLTSAVLLGAGLISTVSVHAQEAAPAPASTPQSSDHVVTVTGSRISARGYNQPTPTTTLTSDDIEKSAQPNVFTTISQLPALQGSTGNSVLTYSTSSGLQGLSAFSLRGLSPSRTLTLLDGQRVVPANVTGVTDISQFPQLLVKRVDVVTGGASASYGSDAIGGVVNFITDKKFTGFKANIQGGQTNYHDDRNVTLQAAWGRGFADDRLHLVVSAERSKEDGVPPHGFGNGPGPNGRTAFNAPAFQTRPLAQTTDGSPQMFDIRNAQPYQYNRYGLITSGPLQGTAFGDGGVPYRFNYGGNGVPDGKGGVSGCISPYCVGGDLSGTSGNSTSLASALTRENLYTRLSYAISPDHEIFMTTNVAQVDSSNTPNAGAPKNANLTIQCDNPFLPASIVADCAANNITSFQYGTGNANFPKNISVEPLRRQNRYVIGADGRFDAGGVNWSYNAYYQRGINHTDLYVRNITLTPRYNAAIDAVRLSDGSIVCRSVAARNAGCQPLNIIGNVPQSSGALAYVMPGFGPQQHTRQTEDVASLNISGEPLALWAGPLAVATGLEYRKEAYVVRADPYGNGVTADSPNSVEYPADPVLNSVTGGNWFAGNYRNGQGEYSVREAYLELNLPMFKSDWLGEASLNVAGRGTVYSTAGNAKTWKVGSTWKTAVDGLRLRAVTSRDVRAPNLSELFAPIVTTNNVVNYRGTTLTVQQQVTGNTALRPETARSTELGVVLTQPRWLPGFSASVDYYTIKVDGVISTLGLQQEVDLCVAGNQEMCAAMMLDSPVPSNNYVRLQQFNLASLKLRGFDIETSYRGSMAKLGVPGMFTLRALATHTIDNITDSGVPGTIPTESAGVNLGSTPRWKLLATQGWSTDRASVTLTERWISNGVYSNEYIECKANCPVATTIHPTIDNNQMKGALYVDLGATYKVSENVMAYAKIDNLGDRDSPTAPGPNVGYGLNPSLFDVLGRMYRVGLRFSL
ncbi:TonB-dependent receptor [Pseudoduganella sp. SL102]|uniref:TonB-dependent receptor plug domain-containing protein n=1 Tax=Pseudoduganella sp. SL102 TaxID=2995154 RepID=UPI00248CB22F|nr:TonB-dependent receptor [Pseudoduganella sp. SL102]WBS01280.1 TonB-dependent receptor [Pseudoduganella sp. SL102]